MSMLGLRTSNFGFSSRQRQQRFGAHGQFTRNPAFKIDQVAAGGADDEYKWTPLTLPLTIFSHPAAFCRLVARGILM